MKFKGQGAGLVANLSFDNQVNQFITGIRSQNRDDRDSRVAEHVQLSTSRGQGEQELDASVQIAKGKLSQMIINAEKFKETLHTLPGNIALPNNNQVVVSRLQNIPVDYSLDVDDQFFHIMCHIDEGIPAKIMRGEYMDLEKLLPKSRGGWGVQ